MGRFWFISVTMVWFKKSFMSKNHIHPTSCSALSHDGLLPQCVPAYFGQDFEHCLQVIYSKFKLNLCFCYIKRVKKKNGFSNIQNIQKITEPKISNKIFWD